MAIEPPAKTSFPSASGPLAGRPRIRSAPRPDPRAVTAVAARVFDLPVIVPAPGEYVALGAAAEAAWLLSGSRPQWRPATSAEPCPDFRPGIRRQYQAAASAKFQTV